MKIKRSIFNKLYAEILEPEVSILLGARQVGKTTLLKQIEEKAKKEGYKTRFFNLESSSDLKELSGDNSKVVKVLSTSVDVVFIDEFHYLKNASKIFKEIYDSKKKVKIYASGSSSLEIHKHLKESLAGRFRKSIIFPLTVGELKQTGVKKIDDYLVWGGMPGLIHRKTNEDKMDLLENIVSTYVTKDIKALIKEENIRAFNLMLYMLAQNQGSMTVVANIAREIGGISQSTITDYLEIMSQTYVCYQIGSYTTNLANELKKSKKCYLFDIGIRNSLLKDFGSAKERKDKGTLYETYVLIHMLTNLKPNMEIKFWRTKKGYEVDFVFLKNRIPYPIEVKSKLNKPEISKGMKKFIDNYSSTKFGIVFNDNITDEVSYKDKVVKFLTWDQISGLEFLKNV